MTKSDLLRRLIKEVIVEMNSDDTIYKTQKGYLVLAAMRDAAKKKIESLTVEFKKIQDLMNQSHYNDTNDPQARNYHIRRLKEIPKLISTLRKKVLGIKNEANTNKLQKSKNDTTTNDGGDENIKMAQSDVTNLIDYSEKLQSLFDVNDNLEDWVKAKLTIACDYVATVLDYLKFYTEEQAMNTQNIQEKWSSSYKKSINCSNPKGFSQKAHCAARRKRQAGGTTSSKSVKEYYKEAVLEILKHQDSSMSMGALKQLNSDAKELETMLQNTDQLEDWVKAKLTMAGTNLQSVFGYLNHAAKTNGQHDDDCDDCMQDMYNNGVKKTADSVIRRFGTTNAA
jgi:hypothetical protein